jgi:hypothetical protein
MDFWLDVLEMSEQDLAAVPDDKLRRMSALLTENERSLLRVLRRTQARRQRNAERHATIYDHRGLHSKTWRSH